jgi:hypothetical protein
MVDKLMALQLSVAHASIFTEKLIALQLYVSCTRHLFKLCTHVHVKGHNICKQVLETLPCRGDAAETTIGH